MGIGTRLLATSFLVVSVAAFAQPALDGDWLLAQDVYGNTQYRRLVLKVEGTKVSGTIGRQAIEGKLRGPAVHFAAHTSDADDEFDGTFSNNELSGTLVHTEKGDPKPVKTTWSARRIAARRAGPPQRHEFVPTTFHRQFSAAIPPVLHISPGDTVHTTTVDAGGTDDQGVKRVLGGNPETGPFFVDTAVPGDVLVVRFTRVRLNRDWAISDDALMSSAMDADLAVKMKDGGKPVRWRLDRERGVASPESGADRLKTFSIPVRPMLGCVAVAPGFAQAPAATGDSGRFGGNMDFNEIVEGAVVYLPVAQPGALLYVGDGHAAQGDGELNGNALETSMEVEFTVDVVPNKPLATPRVESPTHVMTVGLGGTLEDALRSATGGMSQWLEQDFNLTPSEIAVVLGSSIEYSIGEVADRNVAVAAKMRKDRLAMLPRTPKYDE